MSGTCSLHTVQKIIIPPGFPKVMKLLQNTNLFLIIAIFCGLLLPQGGYYLESFLSVLLIILMTLSLKDITLDALIHKDSIVFRPLVAQIGLSILIILLAFFVHDESYRAGLLIMAAVPCAISVIPFSKLLGDRALYATRGVLVIYFASFILTPVAIWLFFRESISSLELVWSIVLYLGLPFVLSRFIQDFEYDVPALNLTFFLTVYGFIALNQDIIVFEFFTLKSMLIILFIRTFIVLTLIYMITRNINLTLFGSYKNLGYAAILSLQFFGPKAALPSTLGIVFETLAFIWLGLLSRHSPP